ncbi:MAG TPA: hypothetical protein VHE11_04980 [Steroidobacteraceae bacterium]|nr:hypothetical protein [Steroidobacteraceae bacterium]
MSPLKIGLLVDGERLTKHVHELVRWANSTDTLRVTHLIVQERPAPPAQPPRLARLIRKPPAEIAANLLWRAKNHIERRGVEATGAYQGSSETLEAGAVVPGRIVVKPLVSKSGLVHRFSEEDLERIRQERFDLLLRCGSGILRGGILTAARLGILSFHHGDNRVNRGGPPGFWEVYHGWSKTGFVVQRLTEELDGGDVILRGFVPTQRSHLLNCALLYAKSYFHLRTLLVRIAAAGEMPEAERQVPYPGRLFVAPGARELAYYLLKRTGRSVSGRARRVLKRSERWGVCYLKSDWPQAALWRGLRLATPPGRFLADPFVVTRDGRTCLFVENYVYRTGKAHISAFALEDSGPRELGIAVEEDFHLSFPFLFEHRGDLFMCPESSAARQIRIYRCLSFPLKWRLECVAMREVAAVDSMIFSRGGAWWLLTNFSAAPPFDQRAELHLFRAADPLSGGWEPHRRNPVVMDPEFARNAGLLRAADGLVRVCQSQGFGSYGTSSNLMRITRLDLDHYAEELIDRITPGFLPGIGGTHHMHSDGIYSVWDYKRWERVKPVSRPAAEGGLAWEAICAPGARPGKAAR